MQTQIGTVISYCTNDFRFIGKCIIEAKEFSSQIVIAVCDHFFDGTPENRALLNQTYAEHPDCQFVEFSYDAKQIYSLFHPISPDDEDWPIYWAATTRYVGFYFLGSSIEKVLFLDSDEILEGKKFRAVLESGTYEEFDALRLGAYYYALKANLRSKTVVNLPLFVKRSTLAPLSLFNPLERIGAYLTHPGPKREKGVGLDGLPFVHHFSWVRTKEECYQKAKTWGHRAEKDWPKFIENTFEGKQMFDDQFEFEEVENVYYDPLLFDLPKTSNAIGSFPHVAKVDRHAMFKKSIEDL